MVGSGTRDCSSHIGNIKSNGPRTGDCLLSQVSQHPTGVTTSIPSITTSKTRPSTALPNNCTIAKSCHHPTATMSSHQTDIKDFAYPPNNTLNAPNAPNAPDDPPAAPADQAWEVEALEDEKCGHDRAGRLKKFYLVRWAGTWPEDQKRSWEIQADISDDLIDEFNERKAEKKEKEAREAEEKDRRRDPDYHPSRE